MRRAILQKFILVLFGALILNGLIFYLVGSRVILNSSTRDMLYMLEVLDGSLDYESDLEKTMKKLDSVMDGNNSRLTVIDLDGTVVADTQAQMDEMDNHLDREEIQDALEKGSGYARRRSDTLDEGMLYVAYRSRNADVILRAAVPYSGFQQYLPLFFPASALSLLVAVVGSFIVTTRLVSSITKPLQDISKEMLKVKGDYTELNFEHCQYPEINVIADTTMKMSKNVKDYLNQIEKERMIRQEFFSNASHELKTPITSIQGYAELLESGMIQDEATKADFASRIKKEAEVTFSDVRVSVLLEEIIDSLKPQAAEAQVFVHVDCQPLMIHANLQQMRELLTNLISNAIKYNRPGGQVWINIRETDGQMVIRVKDNGVGIPSDSLDRIFERFYRVDKGRSRKQGGTGLGLSIVKHIVNFYHGTIHVSSEPDMGSEFTVFLPMFPEKG